MCEAIPDCIVEGFESLIDGLSLPDPDDRHVLAAAIRSSAQLIVTANLKDFPKKVLATYDLEAIHPDDFILDLIDLQPGKVAEVISKQAAALKNPRMSVSQVLDKLHDVGLPQSVAKIRERR